MNRVWFVVWAIVVYQIAAWAFAPQKAAQPAPPTDGPGYGTNEAIFVDGRASTRSSAAKAFELPYGSRCAGEGRKQFISSVGGYYYRRQNETERYPETFGKPGADYIAKQWVTGEDKRIERLTQEAYAQGYLQPSDFDAVARKMVETVVGNERVTVRSCAS
jgi:hypothetical protein